MTESFAIVVGIVVALIQALKRVDAVSARAQLLPFVAVALAVGLMFLMPEAAGSVKDTIIGGLIAGLSACGLYDAAKGTARQD